MGIAVRRKTPARIFDPKAFYKELERCRLDRDKRWIDVEHETGVGRYTMHKLGQGNSISVDTYLALKRWIDEEA